jgi:hypothetical protein
LRSAIATRIKRIHLKFNLQIVGGELLGVPTNPTCHATVHFANGPKGGWSFTEVERRRNAPWSIFAASELGTILFPIQYF